MLLFIILFYLSFLLYLFLRIGSMDFAKQHMPFVADDLPEGGKMESIFPRASMVFLSRVATNLFKIWLRLGMMVLSSFEITNHREEE